MHAVDGESDQSADLAQALSERDLYRRMLELGDYEEIEPFVGDALRLVAEVAGAHQAYLELVSPASSSNARWCAVHGFSADEIDAIRGALSTGIIAAALESGRTIVTQSALLDPRFRSRESVRAGGIQAVLCAPVGAEPPIGVLYLQRLEPGTFSEDDQARVETVARRLAPFADRLLAREEARKAADATRPLRERLRCDGIIGRSAALAAALREVAMVAPLDVNVLLTGESGSGKSQLAWVIHENGPRAGLPLVALNCAALPEGLIESELFGAARGAHSTATAPVQGKVAAAEGGTLFLDEVSELPLPAQAKLLQLLQERIYYPLGSNQPLRADVRVIAATNSNLEEAAQQHRFREDLYYRLHVLPIRVPSLAERRDDVPDLARHFASVASERHRLPSVTFSPDALRLLAALDWPGNVRQLAHVVEAAVIRAAGSGAQQIERRHLFPSNADAPPDDDVGQTFQEATRRFQAQLLRDTLDAAGGSVAEAARRLDITRAHVYNLIRAFGIERERRVRRSS
jgi:transcriptional regulator with GAF, ATPase, and Fis domain